MCWIRDRALCLRCLIRTVHLRPASPRQRSSPRRLHPGNLGASRPVYNRPAQVRWIVSAGRVGERRSAACGCIYGRLRCSTSCGALGGLALHRFGRLQLDHHWIRIGNDHRWTREIARLPDNRDRHSRRNELIKVERHREILGGGRHGDGHGAGSSTARSGAGRCFSARRDRFQLQVHGLRGGLEDFEGGKRRTSAEGQTCERNREKPVHDRSVYCCGETPQAPARP